MSVDVNMLQSMNSFEDPTLGIRERFLKLQIGGASTFGVLSEPLEPPKPIAWVMCHSFGLEQFNLHSIETPVARRMSGAGFPVLRFHAQGYGDSSLSVDQISLGSHIRDTVDAIATLRELTGSSLVGLMGARFGAAVAALVGDRVGAAALALWDPVISGQSFLQGLLRKSTMSDIASAPLGRKVMSPEDRLKDLDIAGFVDLQGFPITHHAYEELKALNLLADLTSFRGVSLIVQISTTPDPRPDIEQLSARLKELGGRSELDVIVHKRARGFGGARFRAAGDGKVDTQNDFVTELSDHTIQWSRSVTEEQSVASSGRSND